MGAVLTVLIVAALGVGYVLDARRNPNLPCRRCGGSGKAYGQVVTRAWRACRTCKGSGRRMRPAVRLLGRRPS